MSNNDIPVTFHAWLATEPEDWKERRNAGEAGNKENPVFMSMYAFNAGIQAGLELASRRLKETIFDRKFIW